MDILVFACDTSINFSLFDYFFVCFHWIYDAFQNTWLQDGSWPRFSSCGSQTDSIPSQSRISCKLDAAFAYIFVSMSIAVIQTNLHLLELSLFGPAFLFLYPIVFLFFKPLFEFQFFRFVWAMFLTKTPWSEIKQSNTASTFCFRLGLLYNPLVNFCRLGN